MLAAHFGLSVTQDDIVRAAGLKATIARQGSRIDQLAGALAELCPGYVVLSKYESTVVDLHAIIGGFHQPIGIEWQGVFTRPDGTTFTQGHYSAVSGVNPGRLSVSIVDPEPMSAISQGELEYAELVRRWWNDTVCEPEGDREQTVRNYRHSFVVTLSEELQTFEPAGFAPATLDLTIAHHRFE